MLPLRPLLKVLGDKEHPLPLVFQVPYLAFLREVYWVKDRDEPLTPQQAQFWMLDEDWWAAVQAVRDAVAQFVAHELTAPMEDYLLYIFQGALPCLSDYLRINWSPFVPAADEHARLLEGIVHQLGRIPDMVTVELSPTEWETLGAFFQACIDAEVSRKPLQDPLAACRDHALHSRSLSSVKLYTLIQRGLLGLQEAHQARFPPDTVDNLASFTRTIGEHLGGGGNADVILHTLVEQMKHDSNLPQRVKVITLRFFTQLLVSSREASPDKLSPMQVKMSDPTQLSIVPLVIMLAEGSDEVVAYEAVDFGTALLEGGNAVAQGALLQWLQNPDVQLLKSFCERLRKSIQILRERKVEKMIIEENDMKEDKATSFKHMLEAKPEISGMPALLRLLQLFCEGHHSAMQNYVRQQQGNPHSVNMVHEVLIFLRELLVAGIDETTMGIAMQAFDTLTEFCQGPCSANQATLMDMTPNVCHEVNQVLQEGLNIPDEAASELRGKAVLTLLSLLEGGNQKRLAAQMVHSLSFDAIRHILDRMWSIIEPTISDTFLVADSEVLDFAFNVYILLCCLRMDSGDTEECESTEVLAAFRGEEHFRSLLGVVEISRDGAVERVYFRKPDCYRMLSQDTRDRVLATVDRESPHRKLQDFFEQAQCIIYEMEYHAYLQQALQELVPPVPEYDSFFYRAHCYGFLLRARGWLVALPRTSVGLWHNCTAFLAVVINVVVCTLTYYEDGHFQLSIHHPSHIMLKATLSLGSSVMLLLNLVTCMSLVVFTMPVLMHHETTGGSGADASRRPEHSLARNVRSLLALHYYDFCLVVFTTCGIVWSPLFFGIHLLSVIQQSALLRSVVRAVTLNGWSLLLTAVLGMIIVYLFTLVAFVLFRDDFVDNSGARYCENLVECFIFSINNGIRAGGGLGELLAPRRWGQPLYAPRVVFDSMYFVVVVVCLLNIVFGIIIDTFAELRDARQKIEEDTKSRCFVCGILSSRFDRYIDGGFREHVLHQHNMWQYLYFMLHLRHKPEDEFTGQESYVHEKILARDISFFPLNRSLELERVEGAVSAAPTGTGGAPSAEPNPYDPCAITSPLAGGGVTQAALQDLERRLQDRMDESNKATNQRLEGIESSMKQMEKTLEAIMAKVCTLGEPSTAKTDTGHRDPPPPTPTTLPRRSSHLLLTAMSIDVPYVNHTNHSAATLRPGLRLPHGSPTVRHRLPRDQQPGA